VPGVPVSLKNNLVAAVFSDGLAHLLSEDWVDAFREGEISHDIKFYSACGADKIAIVSIPDDAQLTCMGCIAFTSRGGS
jgi:hypothetical protein